MVDDPLGALGRELVGAARRMSVGATPTRAGATPTRAGARRLRTSVGAIAAAFAAAVALVVGVGAVVLLGHDGGSGRSGAPARITSTEIAASVPLTLEGRLKALIGTADEGRANMHLTQSVSRQLGFGSYSSFSSTAGSVAVPGGLRIELWELAARPTGKPEIDVLAAVVRGRVIARAPAGRALGHGLVFVYGYTPSGTRVAVVVPNEVTRVRLLVPGARSMLAAVRDNIATFVIEDQQLVRITTAAHVIWYERGGRVVQLVRPVPLLH